MKSGRDKLVAMLLVCLAFCGSALAQNDDSNSQPRSSSHDFVVTLLGTGTPTPSIERFGMSTLIQAGQVNLLIDAGRGVAMRLRQMGLSRSDIDAVFLTHMHSDHTLGLPDLFLTGWIMDGLTRGKVRPFVLYGPKAVGERISAAEMMKRIKSAWAADEYIRANDEKLPADGLQIEAHDVEPGVIFQKNGVKLTAFHVNHGPVVPAFGYRVDYDGRSVVLSGDTTYHADEPLLKVATGADVLIHEVAAVGPEFTATDSGKAIMGHHTSPEDAGRVFSAIKPRLAVYSHIILTVPEEQMIERTRTTYAGPLLIGADLTSIVIGKNAVTVHPPILGLLPISSDLATAPAR